MDDGFSVEVANGGVADFGEFEECKVGGACCGECVEGGSFDVVGDDGADRVGAGGDCAAFGPLGKFVCGWPCFDCSCVEESGDAFTDDVGCVGGVGVLWDVGGMVVAVDCELAVSVVDGVECTVAIDVGFDGLVGVHGGDGPAWGDKVVGGVLVDELTST